MSGRVVGIDIGETTTRAVVGRTSRGAFEILDAAAFPSDDLPGGLAALGVKGCRAVVGVTGRDMILRTTQVPPVPAWQLAELMQFEIADIAEQSGDALSAGFALLSGAAAWDDEDLVLLALVRDTFIRARSAELTPAKVSVQAFTPNAIGLYNAAAATDGGDGVVLVAALRGANTDVALLNDGELVFARNLSGGGDLFTQAIGDAFRADRGKAEAAKRKLGVLARPGQRLEGQRGQVAAALEGGVRQVTGLLQSCVLLCRSQLKSSELRVDRVLLCGPGAALPGLDEALTRSLGIPVERFDPTEGYASRPIDALAEGGEAFAVATGLAMMGTLPDAYVLEVLPESEKRRREFVGKTLWLVLAAVLVVVHLALHVLVTKADYTAAEEDRRRLQREVEARKADMRTYERMLEDVGVLAGSLGTIEEWTAAGTGALAVLGQLDAHLPDELWVTAVRTTKAIEPGFGHGGVRRPMVVVEGKGKEQSRPLSEALVEITTRLRGQPGIATVLPHSAPDPRGDFAFDLRIDTSVFPQRVEDDGDAPAPDAGADVEPDADAAGATG